MRRVAVVMLLAGCVADQTPEEWQHRAIIVASNGELGSFAKEIRPNDEVVLSGYSPVPPATPITTVVPGGFKRALAVLKAEGPDTAVSVRPTADADCPDYGYDMVRIVPPIARFDVILSECPQPALTTLMRDVLAAVDAPQ